MKFLIFKNRISITPNYFSRIVLLFILELMRSSYMQGLLVGDNVLMQRKNSKTIKSLGKNFPLNLNVKLF